MYFKKMQKQFFINFWLFQIDLQFSIVYEHPQIDVQKLYVQEEEGDGQCCKKKKKAMEIRRRVVVRDNYGRKGRQHRNDKQLGFFTTVLSYATGSQNCQINPVAKILTFIVIILISQMRSYYKQLDHFFFLFHFFHDKVGNRVNYFFFFISACYNTILFFS